MTTYGRLVLPNAEPALVAGAPQSGAMLTVYLTGTTTLADLFSDQGVTPILNPQTSNSAGLFYTQTTVIFADDSVAYDCLLEMPEGTSYTYDDLFLLGPSSVTSGFAPLNSPAFTGTPTAPTPASNDDSSKLATTAFVANAIASAPTGIAFFQQQQASGTASGEAISATTWTQRLINTTVSNTIAGASLGTNQITLPAGTYLIWASATAEDTSTSGQFSIRLRNATASATILVSGSTFVTNGINNVGHVEGIFTLAGTAALEIDQYQSAAGTGGIASSTTEKEIYVSVLIQQVP